MDGCERAAILLLGLGEDRAAQVMRHLDPKHVQKLGETMTSLANVSQTEIESVVDDFLTASEQQSSLAIDSEEFVRNTLNQALGEERAKAVLDRILSSSEQTGLNSLRWLDAKTISDIIRNEHPQIIATILTYLDSEQAAEVLTLFPNARRVDIVLRMSEIDSINPEALVELGNIIEEQVSTHKGGGAASIGGVKSVADIINNLDSNAESSLMDAIKSESPDLSEKIEEQMFVFENLSDMDGRSIQTLLRDVPSDNLMLALKGADTLVREKIFSNMSKRAAELLRDDLEASGPVKVSEVDAAQKEILAIARKKAEAGELQLGGKGGEEMI